MWRWDSWRKPLLARSSSAAAWATPATANGSSSSAACSNTKATARHRNSTPHLSLLSFDCKFHQLSGRLRIDSNFGQFGPLALLVDPQHGTGSDGPQREAPGKALDILQKLHVCLQKAPVVERAHMIHARLIVEGDDPEGLENGFVVGLGSPNPLDFQNQPVQLE